MGPQSFPTSLCEALKGNVPLHMLELRCEEATRASKQTKLLKDEVWQCFSCPKGQPKNWKGYFFGGNNGDKDPQWQTKKSTFIVRPGCLRKCLQCKADAGEDIDSFSLCEREAQHECDICHKLKPKSSFADSMRAKNPQKAGSLDARSAPTHHALPLDVQLVRCVATSTALLRSAQSLCRHCTLMSDRQLTMQFSTPIANGPGKDLV